MQLSSLMLIVLAILPILVNSDTAHDIKIMKLQIKALIKLQTDTNQKLTQTNQRLTESNQKLTRELAAVKQELNQNLTRDHLELNNTLTHSNQVLKQRLFKANKTLSQRLTQTEVALNQKLSQTSQTLNQKLAQTDKTLTQNLAQTSQTLNQKLTQTSQEVQSLRTKDETLNGYCTTKQSVCGSCYCVEDFNIPEKYFCDCRAKPTRRDCKEHYTHGERTNGLYRISLNTYGMVVTVYCDQKTDGGGWTLIQRRVDGSINFFSNWLTYKQGFGQFQHEHWLGNDNLHLLTAQAVLTGSEVRFELQRKDFNYRHYAKYSSFHVDGESNAYQLHITGYSGNLGDAMAVHNGMKWTTSDRENDTWGGGNCAYDRQGPWWYESCADSTLNGVYDNFKRYAPQKGFAWKDNYRLQYSEIKVRRK